MAVPTVQQIMHEPVLYQMHACRSTDTWLPTSYAHALTCERGVGKGKREREGGAGGAQDLGCDVGPMLAYEFKPEIYDLPAQ